MINMSFKIQLPDDRYLQIAVREDVSKDDEVFAIEEIEEEDSVESESESKSFRRGRRMLRYALIGGMVGGAVVAARSLRRRRSRSTMDVEIEDESDARISA